MIVLIDQDNVLADFDRSFLTEWRKRFPDELFIPLKQRKLFLVREEYPKELEGKIISIFTAPGFFLNLPPVNGALEALPQLIELGHDVMICTSPFSDYENCVGEKYAWIEKHFGRDLTKKIILTKDKTLVKGDVLIDDKPEITGLSVPEWEHIVFDQPWNRSIKNKRRLTWDNWKEVLGA